MEKKRIELLWAKFLDGSALEITERQELTGSLKNNPELKSIFLSDLSLHGALKEMARDPEKENESFTSILTCIEAEKDGDAFVAAFQSRLRTEQAMAEAKQTGAFIRFRQRKTFPVVFGISAAVAFIFILPSILPYFPNNPRNDTQVSAATGISKPNLPVKFIPREMLLKGTAPPGILSLKLGDVEAVLADGTWQAQVPIPVDGKIPLLAIYPNGHVEKKVISVEH